MAWPHPDFSARSSRMNIQVVVEDDGPGIPDHELAVLDVPSQEGSPDAPP